MKDWFVFCYGKMCCNANVGIEYLSLKHVSEWVGIERRNGIYTEQVAIVELEANRNCCHAMEN